MRNTTYFLLIAISQLLFFSCEEEKPKIVTDEKTGSFFEIKNEEFKGNFTFEDINIQTDANENYVKGLKLGLRPDLTSKNKQLKRGFAEFGYSVYLVKLSLLKKDGSPLNSRPGIKKGEAPAPVEIEKIIDHQRNFKNMDFFIPFFVPELSAGKQEIIVKIEGFPAEIDTVKNDSGFGYAYRKKTEKPDAISEILLHYNQPLVKAGSLRVCRFCINPKIKDPHSYDYRVLGSGFPDLYWELFNGKNLIYTSPIEKNRSSYEVCYNTPPFWFSEKDSIRLAFWDNDELSKPDFIGQWVGSPMEVQKLGENNPAIEFDKVNECKIVLDLVETEEENQKETKK